MGAARSALVLVAGLALLVLLLPLGVLVGPVVVPWQVWRHYRFHRRNLGKVFLVATKRRGWFEFITNNVLPAAPTLAECLWQEHPNPGHRGRKRREKRYLWAFGVAKPYLVVVGAWRNRVVPLHETLKPLQRRTRAKDPAVQREVAAILADKLG